MQKLLGKMSNQDEMYSGFTVRELKEQREIIQRAYYQKEISSDQYLDQLETIENEILVRSKNLNSIYNILKTTLSYIQISMQKTIVKLIMVIYEQ